VAVQDVVVDEDGGPKALNGETTMYEASKASRYASKYRVLGRVLAIVISHIILTRCFHRWSAIQSTSQVA